MLLTGPPFWAQSAPPPPPVFTITFEGLGAGPYPLPFSALYQPYAGQGVTFSYDTYSAVDIDPYDVNNHAAVFITGMNVNMTFPTNTLRFLFLESITFTSAGGSHVYSDGGSGLWTSTGLITLTSPITSFALTGTTYVDNIEFNP
jgi:hypothetical protein